MEHTTQTPEVYDFRQYDRIWQRVAPNLEPYPGMAVQQTTAVQQAAAVRSEAAAIPTPPAVPPVPVLPAGPESPAVPVPAEPANLPGAERNPCCMGTEAQDSLEVLKGFLEEEMAGRRHCMALACCVRSPSAARLLRRAAAEKQAACRDLHGAYYLITGSRYASAVAAEHVQLDSLPEALRACYHQEACNGVNYRRAAGETMDLCLQKLFTRLGDQAYRRSEEIMSLLGRILC